MLSEGTFDQDALSQVSFGGCRRRSAAPVGAHLLSSHAQASPSTALLAASVNRHRTERLFASPCVFLEFCAGRWGHSQADALWALCMHSGLCHETVQDRATACDDWWDSQPPRFQTRWLWGCMQEVVGLAGHRSVLTSLGCPLERMLDQSQAQDRAARRQMACMARGLGGGCGGTAWI
jgi:hypothetical protein